MKSEEVIGRGGSGGGAGGIRVCGGRIGAGRW